MLFRWTTAWLIIKIVSEFYLTSIQGASSKTAEYTHKLVNPSNMDKWTLGRRLLLLLLLRHFSRVRLCATPETAAHQAPPSLRFSRQEHWIGLPFPSPMHESEKWKWSRSVVSDPQPPHGLHPTRLPCPWDFPGKSTGVGCHSLLLKLGIAKCLKRSKKIGKVNISFSY